MADTFGLFSGSEVSVLSGLSMRFIDVKSIFIFSSVQAQIVIKVRFALFKLNIARDDNSFSNLVPKCVASRSSRICNEYCFCGATVLLKLSTGLISKPAATIKNA